MSQAPGVKWWSQLLVCGGTVPFLVPTALKVRLELGRAHGDKKGSVWLEGMRCAHHTVAGSCVPIRLHCAPCYAPRKRLGTTAGSPRSRSSPVPCVCPGCAMGSSSACHTALPPRLQMLEFQTPTSLQLVSACPSLNRLRGTRDFTPFQGLCNEILSVVSSTAALKPGPNPKPDNQSSLAMMVNLVNMNEWKTL